MAAHLQFPNLLDGNGKHAMDYHVRSKRARRLVQFRLERIDGMMVDAVAMHVQSIQKLVQFGMTFCYAPACSSKVR